MLGTRFYGQRLRVGWQMAVSDTNQRRTACKVVQDAEHAEPRAHDLPLETSCASDIQAASCFELDASHAVPALKIWGKWRRSIPVLLAVSVR